MQEHEKVPDKRRSESKQQFVRLTWVSYVVKGSGLFLQKIINKIISSI